MSHKKQQKAKQTSEQFSEALEVVFGGIDLFPIGQEDLKQTGSVVSDVRRPIRKKAATSEDCLNLFSIWELFGFILSRATRDQLFVPAFNDFKADYLETRKKKYRGKWAQRWLTFCFWFRFLFLVLECIRVGLQSAVVKFLLWFVSPIGDVIKFMIRRE